MKQLEYLSDVAYLKKKGGGYQISCHISLSLPPLVEFGVHSLGWPLCKNSGLAKETNNDEKLPGRKIKGKNKTEVHEGSIAEMWLHQPNDVRLVSINKDVDISGCW